MYFLLYGLKDDIKYYISNLDPLAWTSSPKEAKKYPNRYRAEYDVLRVFENYRALKSQIDNSFLDEIYVSEVYFDFTYGTIEEKWRHKLI